MNFQITANIKNKDPPEITNAIRQVSKHHNLVFMFCSFCFLSFGEFWESLKRHHGHLSRCCGLSWESLGLAWLGLAWLGSLLALAWLGLAGLGMWHAGVIMEFFQFTTRRALQHAVPLSTWHRLDGGGGLFQEALEVSLVISAWGQEVLSLLVMLLMLHAPWTCVCCW